MDLNFIHRVLTQLINKMITYPNAKINLGLNITEKRPDGYHNLETVFYPINLQDALEVKLLEGEGEYTLKTAGTPIECDKLLQPGCKSLSHSETGLP